MSQGDIKEHQLYISSNFLLIKLLFQNKIAKNKITKVVSIILATWISLPLRWIQNIYLIPKKIRYKKIKTDPIFIIGHWRSGTTHLHYLMYKDEKFITLEAFQAFFYRIAFVSKGFIRPLLNKLMPLKRPQDNVEINAYAPTEEEHPLTNITEKSGMQSFFFPKNWAYFNSYNLFENISQNKINRWLKTYNKLLLQIEWFNKKNKQLLLKNPHNTARIAELIKHYPSAKFIYIHRNPYDVFQSMLHLYNKTIKSQFLQHCSDEEIKARIIECYKKTINYYIERKKQIPKSQLIEVSYDQLSNEPIYVIKRIYEELKIDGFDKVEPKIIDYLNSIGNYQKNKFETISEHDLKLINESWDFSFKKWAYEKRHT